MRIFVSILLALLLSSTAYAQKPPINSVAGPTTSDEFRSIITNPTGTGSTVFGLSPDIITPSITGGTILSPAITGGTLTSPSITGPTVSSATISGSAINGGTVTSTTIAASTITDPAISSAAMSGYSEKDDCTPAITAGALVLDYNTGCTVFSVTVNANLTSLNFTGCKVGRSQGALVYLTGNGSSFSQTWGGTYGLVKWPSATPPVLSGTNGVIDSIMFNTRSGCTSVIGFYSTGIQ